ncbi:ABC multidrug transporter [Colletotrichum karsti]|uniref:ABC multidrug transporter n=1 Tax=Colletotrichum karsti TaxID=1095194 RepID=A0A9P6I354_9PEZI|nr:ABC multidrug transporter [Colletotrichum karsti]KAF9875583.1 ABC multidrug transporter [Colletotrichum karsti]
MSFSCVNDDTLGPIVRGCRDDFDFTVRFEQVILSIVPASIFIVLALLRVFVLSGKPRVASGPKLQWLKIFFIAVYTGCRLFQLVLTSRSISWTSRVAIASDAMSFVVGLIMIPLSFLEHDRSPRPSTLLDIYLLVTLIFDVALSRTLWLSVESGEDYHQSLVSIVSTAVKAAVLALESCQKPLSWYFDQKPQSPEVTSGIIKLMTFFWLKELFLKGYRKILSISDLYLLDESMSAEILYNKFEPRLRKNTSLGHTHALGRSLLRTLAVPLLLPVVPRFLRIGFMFCQPLLIESLLSYLQEPDQQSSPHKGYAFIAAAIIIYVGMALCQASHFYLHERSLFMMRGILASAVYRKTTILKLSASEDSAALTLMNTDVERFKSGVMFWHEYWANPIEIAVACYLLQRQIGPAFVAPIALVAVCGIVASFVAKFSARNQGVWMKAIQKRVGVTSKTISTMKALKISAMTGPVEKLILGLRLQELQNGWKWRLTIVATVAVAHMPTLLGPVVAFATTTSSLDVTRIFTSMAYLTLLAGPLALLLQTFPMMAGAYACLGRIQAYLDKESREDFRLTPGLSIPAKHNGAMPADSEATAITVTQGFFGWEEGKNVLENINIEVPASSLTIIVGPIASGKSTLLKAFLGETSFSSGDVILGVNCRSVGYCDQSPFLYNDTVKANIIGHSPLNPERYDQVIEATMLSADLGTLPKGDDTNVGSNGVTLSGGQRQRVALARALYLESEILIFDDILSGLDANTEEHVFRRVFGPDGIVRRRGVTAVLCTHSVRHLPSANHIVALGSDSTVVEQGSFAKLKSNGKYIQSLKIQESKEASKDADREDTDKPAPVPVAATKAKDAKLAEEKDKARQLGDFAVYKHWFGTMGKWVLAAFLFWDIIYGITSAYPNVWLKFWSEDIASTNPEHSGTFYLTTYALLRVVCLLAMTFVAFICLRMMIFQSGSKLHQQALRTLVGASLRYLTVTDAGTITGLFAQDISLIDTELPLNFINFSLGLLSAIGMMAIISTTSPWLVITYPFLIGVLVAVQMFYLRTSRQLRLLDLEAKGPLYAHFIDTLKGLATLRALGFISSDISVNNKLLDTSQRPAYQLALIQRCLAFVLRLTVAIIAIIVVIMSTQLRANSGYTGASLITIMLFSDVLTMLVQAFASVETSIGAVARIRTFHKTVKPETGPEENVLPEESWPQKGAIDIKGVSASYGASNDAKSAEELALRDLQLEIRPGETVAVCGRTGSGKSSLVLLLLRLLDPLSDSAGEILIDSLPINKVDRDALRRRIIAVSQDPIFLPDGYTIRENLDPFDEADEAECKSVLEQVGLLSAIEDRGGISVDLTAESFSAGQKQLFCLARAVLRRRVRGKKGAEGGILLLDEVSSSVDKATEIEMHEIIHREFKGYTVIMVSHRLDTVMDCDTIVVMDKGRVVEKGEPKVLKDQDGGMFRELWNKGRTSEE